MCTIDGRKVVVTAGDFTVRGGSASGHNGGLGDGAERRRAGDGVALPFVRLLDAAGGSVRNFETIGRTYLPDGNSFVPVDIKLLNTVPGRIGRAGLGRRACRRVHTSLAHWNVMVRDSGAGVPGRAAGGESGARRRRSPRKSSAAGTSTRAVSGMVDNLAEDEEGRASTKCGGSSRTCRRASYEMAPRAATPRRPWSRRAEALRLPRSRANPRQAYNARRLIRARRRRGVVLRDRPYVRAGPHHRAGPASTATRSA